MLVHIDPPIDLLEALALGDDPAGRAVAEEHLAEFRGYDT